jgi:hypothetical protein
MESHDDDSHFHIRRVDMNRFTTGIVVALLLAVSMSHGVLAQDQMQDVVYLKNGSIIRGMIIEQVPGKSLKVQTSDGSVFVYSMDEVERITKESSRADQQAMGPSMGAFGLKGHMGTDVTGGLGFGGGALFLLNSGSNAAYEFGVDVFLHEADDHYDESGGTRTEAVELFIIAARFNWLWNYSFEQSSVFFVAGVGFVYAGLNWKLINETGNTPGTGTLLEDEDYSTAGNLFNLGAGWSSASGFGIRLETPMLFFYSSGNASSFVPTFTLSLMYRF